MGVFKKIDNLISLVTIKNGSAEDIVGEVCTNLYKEEGSKVKEDFNSLPIWLQDIILLIEFDTELAMSGIVGFLENSTGLMLDETIDTLKRINAIDDYRVMNKIKEILKKNGIEIKVLRENINRRSEYEVLKSQEVHELNFEEIINEETNLYLYQDRNIFEYLFEYIDLNRAELLTDIRNL
ncbi:DMP19 family protein [Paenibacillus sp. NPDC058898]|uniref:DMP19 family protein n=1 Tax=Paenibacillus sp. NPDC058898 TaxID=3346669 RepID=UPI003BF520CF